MKIRNLFLGAVLLGAISCKEESKVSDIQILQQADTISDLQKEIRDSQKEANDKLVKEMESARIRSENQMKTIQELRDQVVDLKNNLSAKEEDLKRAKDIRLDNQEMRQNSETQRLEVARVAAEQEKQNAAIRQQNQAAAREISEKRKSLTSTLYLKTEQLIKAQSEYENAERALNEERNKSGLRNTSKYEVEFQRKQKILNQIKREIVETKAQIATFN